MVRNLALAGIEQADLGSGGNSQEKQDRQRESVREGGERKVNEHYLKG